MTEIVLPASKSITNRWLVLQHHANGRIVLENPSLSRDSMALHRLLQDTSHSLNAGDGGTTFRFLLASLACQPDRQVILDGSPRMRERPVSELVEALTQLGAQIEYLNHNGYPPLRITGAAMRNAAVAVDVSRSSQFASALLLIAPFLPHGMELTLTGKPVSLSYIDMTLDILKQAGLIVHRQGNVIQVLPQEVKPMTVRSEGDWSSAAFWYAFVATHPESQLGLQGLSLNSVQGDRLCADYFRFLGVGTEVRESGIRIHNLGKTVAPENWEVDLTSTPDLFPALAVTAFSRRQPIRIKGIAHLRYKESDRLALVSHYLRQAGATVATTEDSFSMIGFQDSLDAEVVIDPHDDHRIAMAFGVVCGLSTRFRVLHPETVLKSYPNFWEDLQQVESNHKR